MTLDEKVETYPAIGTKRIKEVEKPPEDYKPKCGAIEIDEESYREYMQRENPGYHRNSPKK